MYGVNNITTYELGELPETPDTRNVYRLAPKNTSIEYYRERVDRNIGWITEAEQQIVRNSVIGIAGCGGMGGQLAEKFLRLGVGEIRIADCETFDISNMNRQFAATRRNVGKSKAFETARMLRDITDDSMIVVYPQGIVPETADEFLAGCHVVCDEIEFWAVGARVLLHQQARQQGIPVFNCNTVGFGSRLFLFTPASVTMEECLGLSYGEAVYLQERIRSGTATADEKNHVLHHVIEGLIPELPEYMTEQTEGNSHQFYHRLFVEGKAPIIATNPPLATGFLADRVLLYLLGISGKDRRVVEVPEMPGYLFLDVACMTMRVVRGKWW